MDGAMEMVPAVVWAKVSLQKRFDLSVKDEKAKASRDGTNEGRQENKQPEGAVVTASSVTDSGQWATKLGQTLREKESMDFSLYCLTWQKTPIAGINGKTRAALDKTPVRSTGFLQKLEIRPTDSIYGEMESNMTGKLDKLCDSWALSPPSSYLQRLSQSRFIFVERSCGAPLRAAGRTPLIRPTGGAVAAGIGCPALHFSRSAPEPHVLGSAHFLTTSLLPIGRAWTGLPNGARRWCEEPPPSWGCWDSRRLATPGRR
ncbi:hypothetical protein H8959_001918 [Pygathrix nigripes]